MADTNPFEPPSETTQSITSGRSSSSMVLYAIIGGALGLMIGVLGIVGLFIMIPGAPGVAELLILLIGVFIVFVLPGVGIGVLVGYLSKSTLKKTVD